MKFLLLSCLLFASAWAQTVPPPQNNPVGIDPAALASIKGTATLLGAMLAFTDADIIVNSDLFTDEPKILSGDVGFEGIIGIDVTSKEAANAAGAGWVDSDECRDGVSTGDGRTHTSGLGAETAAMMYNCKEFPEGQDGFPICFSWPIRPSTISADAVKITMLDGSIRKPNCYSTMPNLEFNERHCFVMFGDFFNRDDPNSASHYDVAKVEVPEGSTLELIGPDGPVSAVGIVYNLDPDTSSYWGGAPYFTAAKLNTANGVGDGCSDDCMIFNGHKFPNDAETMYGADATHTIRLFYSGGMTPNGVISLMPWQYEDYFTVTACGQPINNRYEPVTCDDGTVVQVNGLADLGAPIEELDGTPDKCYSTDYDNYIDVSLKIVGDPSVVEKVDYFHKGAGLMNPGGPGDNSDGTKTEADYGIYSGAGKAGFIEVEYDEGDKKRISWCGDNNGNTISMQPEACMSAYQAGQVKQVTLGSLGKLYNLDQVMKLGACSKGDMLSTQMCRQGMAMMGCDGALRAICPQSCGVCGPNGQYAKMLYSQLAELGVEVTLEESVAVAKASAFESTVSLTSESMAESTIPLVDPNHIMLGLAALGFLGTMYYGVRFMKTSSAYTEVFGENEI